MRAHFSAEPIVFWISKAKSVVAQTYSNFSAGGKYCEIVEGFRIINVAQLNPQSISDSATPLLIMATTGLFNNKDQSAGALHIYQRDDDLFGNQSPWERLIERADNGKRRPLLVVYDEGHNLSPQQTELLAELEPDAYLLASATMKLPENFNRSVIQHIKLWIDGASDEIDAFTALHAVENGQPNLQRFITTARRTTTQNPSRIARHRQFGFGAISSKKNPSILEQSTITCAISSRMILLHRLRATNAKSPRDREDQRGEIASNEGGQFVC